MITKEQINQLLKEGQDMYPDLQSTLIKIDKRLNAYVYSNLFDPNAHGTYEKLSVVRFLSFFYKYDFNVKAVKQYIRFSEALPIKSEKGMRTFPLQGFQVFVAANIFG